VAIAIEVNAEPTPQDQQDGSAEMHIQFKEISSITCKQHQTYARPSTT
jgi:hypothetical protein